MKKLVLILVVVLLAGCSKKDDPIPVVKSSYTVEQQKAFTMLLGKFDNIWKYGGIIDTYEFTKIYPSPVDFYADDYINGKYVILSAHGECIYSIDGASENLYFHLSLFSETLELYYKGGSLDKSLKDIYYINISSANKFTLQSLSSNYTYNYVRQ